MIDPSALGLYVHYPFCLSKCHYCDFCSFPEISSEKRGKYVDALLAEIESAPDTDAPVFSLFFGGGTPFLMEISDFQRIIDRLKCKYNFAENAEITVEANPAAASREKLKSLRALGVNRLSIGVQSFRDAELSLLGRIHTAHDAERFYFDAREAGFKNINIDLIYAVPGQTAETLSETLNTVLSLSPEHISAYGLILEEGTDFYRRRQDLAFSSPDDEAALYDTVVSRLSAAGYRHYEISNYARPGYECVQNMGYWQSRPYLGFGASAFSCFGGKRYGNTRELDRYVASPTNAVAETEEMTPENTVYDYVMLALRTADGIVDAEFEKSFGYSFIERHKSYLERCATGGYLSLSDGRVSLTDKGMYVSDAILTEIL